MISRFWYLSLIPQSIRIGFENELNAIAKRLNVQSDWLLELMYSESKLRPAVVNSKSGAVGLIQFMPSTLKEYGLTADYVKTLSALAQLGLVEKYLNRYKGKFSNYVDLYLAVFYPHAIGKNDSYVFGSEVNAARQKLIKSQNNIGNNVDFITMYDFRQWVNSRFPVSYQDALTLAKSNPIVAAILTVVTFFFTILAYKKWKK